MADTNETPTAADAATFDRLLRLENELSVLRRQLFGARDLAAELPDGPFKILRFELDADCYSIPIEYVQETVRYVLLTTVPGVHASIAGALNLRGSIVPVLDLRVRFGLERVAPGLSTPIIIVRFDGRPIGLIVDRVVDVIEVDSARVEAVSGPLAHARAIRGVAHHDDQIVQLIDTVRLLGSHDVEAAMEALVEVSADETDEADDAEPIDDGWDEETNGDR